MEIFKEKDAFIFLEKCNYFYDSVIDNILIAFGSYEYNATMFINTNKDDIYQIVKVNFLNISELRFDIRFNAASECHSGGARIHMTKENMLFFNFDEATFWTEDKDEVERTSTQWIICKAIGLESL